MTRERDDGGGHRAICHPDRRAVRVSCRGHPDASGRKAYSRRCPTCVLCIECWLDSKARELGQQRIRLGPQRIADVEQSAFTEPPLECPKCHRAHALIVEDLVWIRCLGRLGGCGWDGYVISGRHFTRLARPKPRGRYAKRR